MWPLALIGPCITSALPHVFSMSVPILGGLIWKLFGYEDVFLVAGGVALLTAITAYGIPQSVTAGPSPAGVSCPVWPVNGHAVAPTVGNPLDERSDL